MKSLLSISLLLIYCIALNSQSYVSHFDVQKVENEKNSLTINSSYFQFTAPENCKKLKRQKFLLMSGVIFSGIVTVTGLIGATASMTDRNKSGVIGYLSLTLIGTGAVITSSIFLNKTDEKLDTCK